MQIFSKIRILAAALLFSTSSAAFADGIYNPGGSGGGGSGTVTSLSVATANGFAGSVANPTTTPAITMRTSVTGNVCGNGTALSACSTTGTGATVLANTPTLITPVLGVASATSLNKVALTAPATGSTLTIADGKTLTASNTITFTATDGSTLAIGTGGTLGTNAYTSTAYAPLASPTFTGTVTIPTPFTLGATSVTSTGTQLNYLNAATGTTGTASTNVVFSTSPTLVTPALGVATASSLAIAGATIGTDKLAVTGTTTFNGAVVVNAASLSLSGNQSAAAWTTSGVRYKNVSATLTDTSSSGTVAAAYTNVFGGNTIAASSATTYTQYINTYFTVPVAGTNVTMTNKSALGADSVSIGGAAQGSNALAVTGAALFNSTVTMPTPFTLGATSVTATGTQLNYLAAATGTTGTTSTNVVFSTSPSLVTPALGVATATSLAINGATIGSNALAVTGTATLSGTLTFTNANPAVLTRSTINSFAALTVSGDGSDVLQIRNSDSSLMVVGLGFYGFSSNNSTMSSNADTRLYRVSAGVAGFGTTAQNGAGAWLAAKGTLTGGTLADQAQVLSITATQPTTPTGTQNAVSWTITGAGSASQTNYAHKLLYSAGYTGTSFNAALNVVNTNAGSLSSGLFVGLADTTPSVAAALIVDNGAVALPIFLARDNGTTVFTIADGGAVTATGINSITNTTDSTTTTSGALQVAGGVAIRKRVFIDGLTTSAGLQQAVLCQSSGGEMIADSVACLASSERFKTLLGIVEGGALNKIIRLPIHRWKYNEEGIFQSAEWTRERIGPTAEEVAVIDPRLAGYDSDGRARNISQEQLLALVIQAIQELKADNDNLRAIMTKRAANGG